MDPLHPLRTWHAPKAGAVPAEALGASLPDSAESGVAPAAAPALKARVAGLDPATGRDMPASEQATLGDWFAVNLLRSGTFPRTLEQLSAAIDALNASADPRPQENVFVISETGQLRWTAQTADLARSVRYALARGATGDFGADLLVSTRPPSDSLDAFLQVASWDNVSVFKCFATVGRLLRREALARFLFEVRLLFVVS